MQFESALCSGPIKGCIAPAWEEVNLPMCKLFQF